MRQGARPSLAVSFFGASSQRSVPVVLPSFLWALVTPSSTKQALSEIRVFSARNASFMLCDAVFWIGVRRA
jgi:hypothetical protein